MKKNTLAYFDCGHAALDVVEGVSLYKLPARLSLDVLAGYLPAHLRGKTQVLAYPASLCQSCHKGSILPGLLKTIRENLEEEGLPVPSDVELHRQVRAELVKRGLSEDAIKALFT